MGKESFQKIKTVRNRLDARQARQKYPGLERPRKIAIIGDTGCRLKETKIHSLYQNCADPKAWPYPKLIEQVAKEKPDLIIHLGDYHYREQCSKGKKCEKMTTAAGYGFAPWQKDFLEPSQPAFRGVPWIIARGNHEDCERAYLGYRSLLVAEDWNQECIPYEEPQLIQWKDLTIVVLDTSTISDLPITSDATDKIWAERFSVIEKKLAEIKSKHVWIVTHKPFYGLTSLGSAFAPINMNLRKYLDATKLGKRVELLLAGHVHSSQLVQVAGMPLQVVLGNGGAILEKGGKSVSSGNLNLIGYDKAKIITRDFGYAMIQEKKQGDYSLEFYSAGGALLASCSLKNKGAGCFSD